MIQERWNLAIKGPSICLIVFVGGCSAPATSREWQIVPGQRAGAITRSSTEAQLARAYGGDAVRQTRIDLGEGETGPGTVLFPGDSLRRLEVLWHDTVARARPARLILRGTRSDWHLPRAISLGTRLRELERQNGGGFMLAGFGWDHGGVVFDWSGGALAAELVGVRVYLDPGATRYQTPEYSKVLGEREYPSSAPDMQSLDPGVYQIFVDFE